VAGNPALVAGAARAPSVLAFIRRHIQVDERRLGPAGWPLRSGVHPPLYPGWCTPVSPGRPAGALSPCRGR